MKTIKIIIITILITLLMIGGAYILNKSATDLYKQRLDNKTIEGYNQGVYDIILTINQNGKIPILNNSTGVLKVNWIDIKEICKEIK